MTYNNSTQINQDEYDSDLQLIQELTKNFELNKKKLIICGDFNTDMSRLDSFIYSLNYMLVKINYMVADLQWHQQGSINLFFLLKLQEKWSIQAWIDHFLVEQSMENIISCKITPMINNTGHHHPIKIIKKTQED